MFEDSIKENGTLSKIIKLDQKKPQKGNKSNDILKHFKGGKKERKQEKHLLVRILIKWDKIAKAIPRVSLCLQKC